MSYFLNIDIINELEQNQQYDNLINYLYLEWRKDQQNVDITLRLSSECWFLLTEAGISIDAQAINYNVTKKILVEVFEYAKSIGLLTNVKNSWFFGYALSLFPFHFFLGNSNEKFINYQKEGQTICYNLLQEKDTDDIIKYLCCGCLNDINMNALKVDNINQAFSGKTLIEEYFKEICFREISS